MNPERIKELENFELKSGAHKSIKDGACIMELVSYVANEPWSDNPKCACPILTQYAIRLNDQFNDEHRQRLKPLILSLLDSRMTDEVQIKRKQFLMFRNVTSVYPLLLEAIKLPEIAEKLRSFQNNVGSMNEAAAFLKEKKEEIRNADAYATADAYADAYANANAYATANAYADAYANAFADAYAYAYANANANALREKIATVAIETLRLACEIGKEEPHAQDKK